LQVIIDLQGGIFIVIYADVLFIVNFFITLLLLELTAKAGKRNPKTFRIVISSALGGAYSLIILIDDIPIVLLLLSKIVFAILLILISFSFVRLKSFLSMLLIFLFSNFVFLGIIAGLQMIFHSDRISINNGEIYFDINARQLLFAALFAYAASSLIIRLYNKKLSAGEIYSILIFNNGKQINAFALSDTGNKLREPFSNAPVIIVKSELLQGFYDEEKARLIPASTINSKSFLYAFKPECVKVKTSKGWEIIENVYIASSDEINSKSFSAIINPEIISV
jgi:stage II sporulation protein GA (sporulation sigma-E factor processing peptidase)